MILARSTLKHSDLSRECLTAELLSMGMILYDSVIFLCLKIFLYAYC